MGKNSPYVEGTDLWKESFGRFTITKVGVVTAQTDIQMDERQDTGDVRLIRGVPRSEHTEFERSALLRHNRHADKGREKKSNIKLVLSMTALCKIKVYFT